MKKKLLFSILMLLLVISIAACKQSVKSEPIKNIGTQGAGASDASVDAVGKGLSNVDSDVKDLNADNLSDLDSGLNDVQNI